MSAGLAGASWNPAFRAWLADGSAAALASAAKTRAQLVDPELPNHRLIRTAIALHDFVERAAVFAEVLDAVDDPATARGTLEHLEREVVTRGTVIFGLPDERAAWEASAEIYGAFIGVTLGAPAPCLDGTEGTPGAAQ